LEELPVTLRPSCRAAAVQRITVPLICFVLAACGDDSSSDKGSGGATGGRENGMTFADDAALPPCNPDREGFLVYVTATANFRTCGGGQWSVIDLKGEKGEKGEIGATGQDAIDAPAAINVYKKYKHSVFRTILTCSLQAAPPSGCGSKPTVGSGGTAFLCGDKSVCTNEHVVSCPTCYEFASLELQAIEGDADSVNTGGQTNTAAAPFVTLTSNASIRLHSKLDLARFPIESNPPKATPIPLSAKPTSESVSPLQKILSISFPLGFEDLYADVGAVNTPSIGHCQESGNGCLSQYYQFSTSNDTDHGSSGSPLIDVLTGTVVGVTTGGTEGQNANFTWAVDASKLRDIE
jgi:hypothetical protein